MEIPDPYIICDTRISKDFKNITMSGYKRKDVINAFQNSMINSKLEDSIRWCVELHSTGLNNIIWDSLLTIYFKYVHIDNPKFLIYFLKREKDYLNIVKKYPKKHEIFSRNNQEIRNLYGELTAILSLTKKNNIFIQKSLPTINSTSFQKDDIYKRMISRDLNKIGEFIFNTTSNEIKFALNEIVNNLDKKRGTYQNCIYWYLWIEKNENLKKNKDKNIVISNNIGDNQEYFDHWVFILWNIILSFEEILSKNTKIFLNKLHSLYKKKFKITQISKKKYIFFISFYIIKNDIKWNKNLLNQEYLIIQSNGNINKMYYNIITNSESALSNESIKKLHENYDNLVLKILDKSNLKHPKKIINTTLNNYTDNGINKVLFSKYPDYEELKKNNMNSENDRHHNITTIKNSKDNNLVYTNMTIIDVNNSIEERKNKKLSAFRDFITFKKPKIDFETKENNIKLNSTSSSKSLLDMDLHNLPKEYINSNKTILDYYNEESNKKQNDEYENNEQSNNNEYNIIKKTISVNNIFNDSQQKIKSINFSKRK